MLDLDEGKKRYKGSSPWYVCSDSGLLSNLLEILLPLNFIIL
ncbi:unnamed protein product [Brassica rapa subsp. narinosa]